MPEGVVCVGLGLGLGLGLGFEKFENINHSLLSTRIIGRLENMRLVYHLVRGEISRMFTIPTNLSTLTLTLTLTVTNAYREPSGNGVVGVP